MDHKEFFENHGQDLVAHDYWVTNEQLYQILKARLMEELRCDLLKPAEDNKQGYVGVRLEQARLIDTTSPEEGNEA